MGTILALALLYFLAARLGQLVAIPPGNITPVYPASGIALAAILLWDYRLWPGVWLGQFFGNIWAFYDGTSLLAIGLSTLSGAITATGASLQALLGAYLLRHWVGERQLLQSAWSVLIFAFIAIAVCCISPTLGVTGLCTLGFLGWSQYLTTWWTWWLGDAAGVIVLVPIALTVTRKSCSLEMLAILGCAIIGSWLCLVGLFNSFSYALAYVVWPLLILTAFRQGVAGVALVCAAISLVAIVSTAQGTGPFILEDRNTSLILLQTYVGTVTLTGLILAAALTSSKVSEARFKTLFERAPEAIVILDCDQGRFVDANQNAEQLFGLSRDGLRAVGPAEMSPPFQLDGRPSKEAALEWIRHGMEGQFPVFEWVHRNAQGQDIHCEVRLALLPSVSNNLIRGSVVDITERKRAAERLRALSQRVVQVQEEERRHLAYELHDDIGQVLTAIRFGIEAVDARLDPSAQQALNDCLGIVSGAMVKVRNLSLELRPSMLDTLGLHAALQWYIKEHSKQLHIHIKLESHLADQRPRPEVETSVFRVVQEALTNIARHARAHQVWISLRQDEAGIQVVIRDDGVGFNVPTAKESCSGGGFGLLSMRERVEHLGGRFEIESVEKVGTTVRAWLPCSNHATVLRT